ncbi:hypothetical protein L208DRAFT_1546015 [Tricholoma matsutake]|nr:hypothetical protein L208DRAFT_1546015 [Tricholoma matsutake 945]
MTTMNQVHELLNMVPGLGDSITMETAMEFIWLGASLKDVIIMVQPAMHHEHDIPNALPPHVRSFLGLATNISEAFVDGCWTAFNSVIWNFEGNTGNTSKRDAAQFRAFGLDHLLNH